MAFAVSLLFPFPLSPAPALLSRGPLALAQAVFVRFKQGGSRAAPPPRQAFCVVLAPPSFDVHEVVVTLSPAGGAAVESWARIDGASLEGQPLATPDDCLVRPRA